MGHARIHHHFNQGTHFPTAVSFVWPSQRTTTTVLLHVLNSELMCLVPAVDEISLKRACCYYLPCYDVRFPKGQPSLACSFFCSDGLFLFDRRYELDCFWWILQNVNIHYNLWCLIWTHLQASHSLMLICNGYLVLQVNCHRKYNLTRRSGKCLKKNISVIHFNRKSIRKQYLNPQLYFHYFILHSGV
jgi:hypothetical protein